MGLAVALGVLIATGRVYGAAPVQRRLIGYVELMRGTPILLQLFVLYYGIAAAIRLPAFVGGAARTGAELRRLRKRDLPRGARGGLDGSARSGANARIERTPGPDARARPAGFQARPGADDQRLRRHAQGLVARLGPDRPRADEADADLRDQPRQLGHSRHCCARRSIW